MNAVRKAELIPYIPFDRASAVPFYVQIYNGFLAAIVSGRLRPGQRLPSSRALATELCVSRIPVLNAFDQLLHEGYLEGRVGSGTYVRARRVHLNASGTTSRTALDCAAVGRNGAGGSRAHGVGPFSNVPAFDGFPHKTWARLIRRHACRPSVDLFARGDPAGYAPLREAVGAYVSSARGVDCDAGQVLIVSGPQMGLRICALAFATAGSALCVEEPCRPSARAALDIPQNELIPVSVDGHGIDVCALERLGGDATAVYVTPDHQDPLGVAMTASRRQALLSWADEGRRWIVEGDYDSAFRYSTRPLGALQGIDTAERVIYVGTFSNVLFPDIRLGYLVVPRSLLSTFIRIRESLDGCSPTLYQRVLTDFLGGGHFARHVRRMQTLYSARRQVLVERLHEHLGDVVTLGTADAGLHVVAFLPDGVDDQNVVRKAAGVGLFPQALSTFYVTGRAPSGLLLGFGGANESTLETEVRTLGDVIRRML